MPRIDGTTYHVRIHGFDNSIGILGEVFGFHPERLAYLPRSSTLDVAAIARRMGNNMIDGSEPFSLYAEKWISRKWINGLPQGGTQPKAHAQV